jgi:hypothetical protein
LDLKTKRTFLDIGIDFLNQKLTYLPTILLYSTGVNKLPVQTPKLISIQACGWVIVPTTPAIIEKHPSNTSGC